MRHHLCAYLPVQGGLGGGLSGRGFRTDHCSKCQPDACRSRDGSHVVHSLCLARAAAIVRRSLCAMWPCTESRGRMHSGPTMNPVARLDGQRMTATTDCSLHGAVAAHAVGLNDGDRRALDRAVEPPW
jgi:hypothetical protein